MKIKLPKNYKLSEAYHESSCPYGKVVPSLNRSVWFLKRTYKKSDASLNEYLVEYWKKYGKVVGEIKKYDDQRNRYIIPQTFPTMEFKTIQTAINYLIKNEGKISYCS